MEDLERLHKEIWEHHSGPASYGTQYWSTEKRRLTDEELAKVLEVAKTHPCTIYNACMGFGIGMTIWSHPLYPGLPTEGLFHLTSLHLPGVPVSGHDHFHKGWEIFSAVALRPENVAWCKELKLEEPRDDKWHYDY